MFPLQQRDELVFGAPSTHPGEVILQSQIANHAFPDNDLIDNNTKESKRKRSDECNVKRVLHRENERHRRQEMANLYASLRTLLPLEYIKGKRSVSDHMQEAVNYIKHMQERIQELKMRLEKRSNFSGTKMASSNSNEKLVNRVVVTPGREGVEILISSSCKSFGLGLSGVLQELQARGLNVVSCLSTKENDQRFLHKIHAELIDDLKDIDLPVMQERLLHLIN
ncbi:transcription factor bHLH36-like [Primulina huaijiensis]|uniref:transcription factor bHLH36-like n=1 Tax=Primulina huaijiensis TaxID=1492673 RepID=UPI003CC77712